ncbi:MAG: DivIVA domain-containing protein [Pseudobdellovibrionaceae bacterium]
MKVSPIDIAHKTFSKKLMGLDANEVAEFMSLVSDQLEELVRERNSLREAIREKELMLLDYKERDQMLKNTIATASQISEKIRTDAEREAKLIIGEANQKSEMLVKDARESLRKIYQDISDLKKTRLQFEANLKALAQAHLGLLEQGEKYIPNPAMPNISMATNAPAPSATTGITQGTSGRAASMSARSTEVSPLSST